MADRPLDYASPAAHRRRYQGPERPERVGIATRLAASGALLLNLTLVAAAYTSRGWDLLGILMVYWPMGNVAFAIVAVGCALLVKQWAGGASVSSYIVLCAYSTILAAAGGGFAIGYIASLPGHR